MAPLPQPEDYPIDTTTPLKPTKAFFLETAAGFSTSARILDLTSRFDLPNWPSYSEAISDGLVKQAEAMAAETPMSDAQKPGDKSAPTDSPEAYTLTKKSWLSLTMQLRDARAGGALVAELASTVRKMGVWDLTFMGQPPHSSHAIEMKPVGLTKKTEIFVVESIPYYWSLKGGKQGTLHKVVDGKRVVVGEFSRHNRWKTNCLFLVDERNLDAVVAILTCAALLNRIDSWEA